MTVPENAAVIVNGIKMFGTTIRHCLDCRKSWEEGCLFSSECPYCKSKNLEEYNDSRWRIDKDGRIVQKEPINLWKKESK